MKLLKERAIGETFKYRKNIVAVSKAPLYFKCSGCQFKNQTSRVGNNCDRKHKCDSRNRQDKQSVRFIVIQKLDYRTKK